MTNQEDWRDGYDTTYRNIFIKNLSLRMEERYTEGRTIYGDVFHGDPLVETEVELIDALYYLNVAMNEARHNRALLMTIKFILNKSKRKDIKELEQIRNLMDNFHQPPNNLDPKAPQPVKPKPPKNPDRQNPVEIVSYVNIMRQHERKMAADKKWEDGFRTGQKAITERLKGIIEERKPE